MRAREVKLWLDALVEMAGNDAFDREVANHVVRVLELVQGPSEQKLFGHWFPDGPEGEMARYSVKLLKARADAARAACPS